MNNYENAKQSFKKYGVDTEQVLETLASIPVSLHCWQGDDVTGFDHDGPLTGGIQTTGNYLGKARTPDELMQDIEKVMTLVPGKKKINVHACYAIFEKGEFVDRDKLEPKHFKKWLDFAMKFWHAECVCSLSQKAFTERYRKGVIKQDTISLKTKQKIFVLPLAVTSACFQKTRIQNNWCNKP